MTGFVMSSIKTFLRSLREAPVGEPFVVGGVGDATIFLDAVTRSMGEEADLAILAFAELTPEDTRWYRLVEVAFYRGETALETRIGVRNFLISASRQCLLGSHLKGLAENAGLQDEHLALVARPFGPGARFALFNNKSIYPVFGSAPSAHDLMEWSEVFSR